MLRFRRYLSFCVDVNTALDVLCFLCKDKLVYAPGEKDMIVMRHAFEVSGAKHVTDVWESPL